MDGWTDVPTYVRTYVHVRTYVRTDGWMDECLSFYQIVIQEIDGWMFLSLSVLYQ